MELLHDEILSEVNHNLTLIQKKNGLTFGTDAYLLYAYMKKQPKAVACDFGCGTGIISLLCATKEKFAHIYAVDVQEVFCDLARRNAEYNNLNSVEVVCCDVRSLDKQVDVVFSNPPYMKHGHGKSNTFDEKNIARHEVHGEISDFVASASRVLKFGGLFYCVYRPDRLIDLICAMRAENIEPKRMTYVYYSTAHEPSMVLIEGKKGAKSGLFVTPPFLMKKDGMETEDYRYVYERGEFGEQFLQR